MAARARRCPDCSTTWTEREARYCGNCGGPLATPRRRSSGVANTTRSVIPMLLVVAGVVAIVSSGVGPGLGVRGGGDRDVDLDAGAPLAGAPPNDEEVAALLDQADPDRLRCDPRAACTSWRSSIDGRQQGAGAVIVGGGVVLTLLDATDGDPSEMDPVRVVPALVAVEMNSGEQRWEVPLSRIAGTDVAPGDARLVGLHEGALLVTHTVLAAIGAGGEVVWSWRSGDDVPDDGGHTLGDVTVMSDVVYVHERRSRGASQVAARDAVTGRELWSAEAAELMTTVDGAVVVADDGGRLRALDAATGSDVWVSEVTGARSVRAAGPWLAVTTSRNDTALVDRVTGDTVASLAGRLITDLVPVEGGWLGVSADTRAWVVSPKTPGDVVGRLEVVALDRHGAEGWSEDIGTHDPWEACCELVVGGDSTVVVGGATGWWEFAVTTGELLRADERPGPGSAPLERTWHAAPDVEVVWHRDGQGLELRRPDGAVTVRGGHGIAVESIDPLVVSDGRHLLAVEP